MNGILLNSFRFIITIAMTVELGKNSTCANEPQGVIGITLVSLGYLKYSLLLIMVIFYCIYFRTALHIASEDEIREACNNSDQYLNTRIAIMPDNETCSVCMDEKRHETSVGLECGHYFHLKCLKDWIRIKGSCPMCRRQLV